MQDHRRRESLRRTGRTRSGRKWAGDAEVVVVDESVKTVGAAVGGCLQIKAATSLMIEIHRDACLAVGVGGIDARPRDRPVLAVVGDAPGAGLGGD